MIFTRRADVSEYIQMLLSIVEMMGEDLLRCARIVDNDISLDDIVSSYIRAENSPTILESILIEDGKLTREEARKNHLMENIIQELEERHDDQRHEMP